MNKFVAGKADEIPSEIIRILTEKETFIRDLVMRYPQWFSQDMGQIMEKELEDVLEEFRGIPELDPVVSDRVDALARARDLLLDFHSIIAERENIKQNFSVDSLLELVNRKNLPIISENQLKMMKSNFDLIKRDVDLLNFEYENFDKLILDLEGYIWRLEVQSILRNKNSTPLPSQLYKMLRSCPDMECSAELRKLGKKLKIQPMEAKEAKKAVTGWLSGDMNLQESRRGLERALITDLSESPEIEEQVRLANKVLNNENKLTEATTQRLIDFGLGHTKLVQKFLGKETLKKQAEQEKLDDTGVFREENVHEMIEEKMVMESNIGSSAITPEKISENPADEGSQNIQDHDRASSDRMDIEEPETKVQEIMELEKIVSNEEPQEEIEKELSQPENMAEESLPEEEIEVVTDHIPVEAAGQELMTENTRYTVPVAEPVAEEQPEATSEKMEEEENISEEEEPKADEEASENEEVDHQDGHEEMENCPEPEIHATTVEPEAPKMDTPEKKTTSGKKPKPLLSFDDAVEYFREGKKPETFTGTQEQFDQVMTYINWTIKQFKQRTELSKFSHIIEKLARLAIEAPDIKEMQSMDARATKLRDLALGLTNEELIQQREQLEAEYRSVPAIQIIELDMMFSEMDRDWQTSKDVKEAMDKREEKSLEEMVALKNRVDAARYYTDKVDKFKIYDLFVMSLIKAWKSHDQETGKPQLDYHTLKDVYAVIEEDAKGKDTRYIHPTKGEFVKNLYNFVRAEYKKIFESLAASTSDNTKVQQSYKKFVDFTSKLVEFKNRIQKEEKTKKDETSKLAHVLNTAGKKSKLNIELDYSPSEAEFSLVKPAFRNEITQQHKKYFVSSLTHHLETNKSFKLTHEQAVKRAGAIERDLYDNNLTKPIHYEHIGVQFVNFLNSVKKYKYISFRVMNKKFNYDYLLKQMHIGADQMPKWDAEYKKQYVLGKEVRNKKGEIATIEQKNVGMKYDPEEANNRMMQEPIEGQDYVASSQENKPKSKFLLSKNMDIRLNHCALVRLDVLSYRVFEGDLTYGKDDSSSKKFSNVSHV